jgi:hypothetical protein
LTKNGKLRTFATSLVDDANSRALRALVDNGYLTYEYTGTQRIYTVTDRSEAQLPVAAPEGKTVAKKKTETAGATRVDDGPKDRPASSQSEVKARANVPTIPMSELCRAALAAGQAAAPEALCWARVQYPEMALDEKTFRVTFSKIKRETRDESAPTPGKSTEESVPPPTKSKPHAGQQSSPPPTLTDLLAVGKMAAQHGGAKKLLGVVALVDDLARKVGGIDRLRQSLEGLESLAKLFK